MLPALARLFVPRAQRGPGPPIDAAILIPARNAEQALKALLPALKGAKLYVYDDQSTDRTAEVAAEHGAIVLRATSEPAPSWTRENRACHSLAQAAAEDFSGEWFLFLDAHARPHPDLLPSLQRLVTQTKPQVLITKHPSHLNDKISLWRASKYMEVLPHEHVKDEAHPGPAIARLLARNKIPITTCNLSAVLDVQT